VQVEKQSGLLEEPYDFEKCTISIGIQLLPDDGSGDRQVLIGVRNHSDPPLLKILRQSELGDLPPAIAELLVALTSDLPNRKDAWEKKREAEETAREKQRMGKTKVSRKATTTNQVQTANIVRSNGIPNTENTNNATEAPAVQMSLFDTL